MRTDLALSIGPMVLATACAWSVVAHAQLPAPKQTIFKCEVNGVIKYSDKPCLGAQRLDLVIPRGADRLSGSTRIGNEVAREIRTEQLAKALAPVAGVTGPQFATASRRQSLSAALQQECRQLEAVILQAEQMERGATGAGLQSIQKNLLNFRHRFSELAC